MKQVLTIRKFVSKDKGQNNKKMSSIKQTSSYSSILRWLKSCQQSFYLKMMMTRRMKNSNQLMSVILKNNSWTRRSHLGINRQDPQCPGSKKISDPISTKVWFQQKKNRSKWPLQEEALNSKKRMIMMEWKIAIWNSWPIWTPWQTEP